MRLLSVLFFLTLVVLCPKNWAAPQNDYPQPQLLPQGSAADDDLVTGHLRSKRNFSGISLDFGSSQGYFYDKNESKNIFYIGTTYEFEWNDRWWAAAIHLGSAGHAFFKLGPFWIWNERSKDQYGARVYLVNNLEVSQYFASLVNYNHYKLELNIFAKNLFEDYSGVSAEIAAAYGLNGTNFSVGLNYSF